MDQPKTYFILRTTDYAPDDLIQLGQLIPDPRLPYRRLAAPLQPAPTPRTSSTTGWALEKYKSAGGDLGVFAHFFETLTAEASVHASRALAQTWSAATFETRFLELGTDDEYVKQSVEPESVQRWLKEHRKLGKTVYIVTGVKIAIQPGESTVDANKARGASVSLGVDPGTGGVVAAGGKASFDKKDGTVETGSPGADFVFAYRLRKVHVSWRNKVTLGNDVEGADLWGQRPEHGSDDDEPDSSDEDDDNVDEKPMAEDEISAVLLEKADFGSSLPAMAIKFDGVDDDGEKCQVVLASS